MIKKMGKTPFSARFYPARDGVPLNALLDYILVGPSLKGIGAKFDAQYLADAITAPDKDVPEGFYPGIMPAFNLPAEDLANLVKYMQDAK